MQQGSWRETQMGNRRWTSGGKPAAESYISVDILAIFSGLGVGKMFGICK